MVYQRLCVIRDKNYADPADFANDVLSLMASFERKQAAEQERALDFCPTCDNTGYRRVSPTILAKCSCQHGQSQ